MYYIKSIKLINIRGFRELTMDLNSDRNILINNKLIIGKNGTCKTTILRCVAIGLCDEADGNALLPEPFGELISEDKNEAEIIIEVYDDQNPKKVDKIITKIGRVEGKEVIKKKQRPPDISIFACGYGSGRCFEGTQAVRAYRIADSVYSLFQYHAEFWPTELVIRRLMDYLKYDIYKKTAYNIKSILGLDPNKDKFYVQPGGGIFISGPSIGKKIPIEGWADGFQMTFLWILDLYGWALIAKKISKEGQISGIVLIDEIEQHLHPSLEINILNQFKKFLPDIQIIATTHSPIVALGSDPEELVVLRRKGKFIYKEKVIPDYSKYSVDDIVSDDRIFASAIYRTEYEKKLKVYNKLINTSKDKLSKKESNRIKKLAKELLRSNALKVQENELLQELKTFKEKYNL